MHALKFDNEILTGSSHGSVVRVGAFLEGLYRCCRERYDSDTSNAIVDDTYQVLAEAGFGPLEPIGHDRLAALILTSTRAWEYVGPGGTIDLVREQRDYTRSLVGDAHFWHWYSGLETIDGRSYYAPLQ